MQSGTKDTEELQKRIATFAKQMPTTAEKQRTEEQVNTIEDKVKLYFPEF